MGRFSETRDINDLRFEGETEEQFKNFTDNFGKNVDTSPLDNQDSAPNPKR